MASTKYGTLRKIVSERLEWSGQSYQHKRRQIYVWSLSYHADAESQVKVANPNTEEILRGSNGSPCVALGESEAQAWAPGGNSQGFALSVSNCMSGSL